MRKKILNNELRSGTKLEKVLLSKRSINNRCWWITGIFRPTKSLAFALVDDFAELNSSTSLICIRFTYGNERSEAMSSSRIIIFPDQENNLNVALRRLIEVFQATELLYKSVAARVDNYNFKKLCSEQATLRATILKELCQLAQLDEHSEAVLKAHADSLQQCYTQLNFKTETVSEAQLCTRLVTAEQTCLKILKAVLQQLSHPLVKRTLAGIVARMQITLDQLCKMRSI